jgi:hypothetical protein
MDRQLSKTGTLGTGYCDTVSKPGMTKHGFPFTGHPGENPGPEIWLFPESRCLHNYETINNTKKEKISGGLKRT